MLKSGLAAVLGLALMASPGALGYGDPAASLHHTIGPIIVTFSVIAVWESTRSALYVNLPLAAALVAGTPIATLDAAPIIVSLVIGPGAAALALRPGAVKGRYGGGWRVLLQRPRT